MDEDEDGFLSCEEDSDKESLPEDFARRRRKKERKVPLSEEESERKRILANSQERGRMNRLNRALANLRRVLPEELSLSNRRLSKIRTIRLAGSYIRDLTKLLAEDDANRNEGRGHPQFVQPQYPYCYYTTPPQAYPQPQIQSPAFATPPAHFAGEGSGVGDEGYYSSFCHDSSQVQESSFLGGSYPATPHFFPYPHPSMSSVSSPDEGIGERSSCAVMSPAPANVSMFSACGPQWLSSTPVGTHIHPESLPGSYSDLRQEGGGRVPVYWEPAFTPGEGETSDVLSPPGMAPQGGFLSSPVPPSPLESPCGPTPAHQPQTGFDSLLPVQFSTPLTNAAAYHQRGLAARSYDGAATTAGGVSEVGVSPCAPWASTCTAASGSAGGSASAAL
ncbi:hypothetical protein ACOMHN_043043 [Nucella lapillus]